jgi:hypothetical protein
MAISIDGTCVPSPPRAGDFVADVAEIDVRRHAGDEGRRAGSEHSADRDQGDVEMQKSTGLGSRVAGRGLGIASVLVALAVVPPAASAAQRFASPTGSLAACTAAVPCDITVAIPSAGANDEVILAPGDYRSEADPLTTIIDSSAPNVDVHGVDGQPRPRLFTNARDGIDLRGAGSKIRHLEIRQLPGPTPNPQALLIENGTASDMIVRTTNTSGGKACNPLGASTISNSVCEATGPDARAIFPYRFSGSPAANTSTIRNVTAVATGTGPIGISAFGGNTAADRQDLVVTNTIIVVPPGQTALNATSGTGTATITVDHSNFGFQNSVTTVIRGPGNQQLGPAPQFVAAGDYHQAASSPTVDKGETNALNGPFDFDGDARSLGLGGTDIGADELVPSPTVVTGDPSAITNTSGTVNGTVNANTIATTYHFDFGTTTAYGSGTTERSAGSGTTTDLVSEPIANLVPGTTVHYRLVATSAGGTTTGADRTFTTTTQAPPPNDPGGNGNGANDRTAPKFVGAIALSSRTFAAAGSGASARPAAKRKKAPTGTTVSFRLDEAASVRFTVERATTGRRSGKSCVKPSKRNRKAKKCTRFVLQKGSFTVAAKAGPNRVKFSGRLNGKKLATGSYRLVAVATDKARNRSLEKRASFKIVRG